MSGAKAPVPVLPEDCMVFVALPGTQACFVTEALRGPADRFAASQATAMLGGRRWELARQAWTREELESLYRDLSAEHEGDLWTLEDSLLEAEAAGVRVWRNVTVTQFLDGVRHTQAKVVTLVAHHVPGGVELRDGVATNTQIAAAFDTGFEGTIDLTVCNSIDLHDAIRERTGDVPRMILNGSTAYLGMRISAFRLTTRLLREFAPISFVAAYSEAWSRLVAGGER